MPPVNNQYTRPLFPKKIGEHGAGNSLSDDKKRIFLLQVFVSD